MIRGLGTHKVTIPHEPGHWMIFRSGLAEYDLQPAAEEVAFGRAARQTRFLQELGPEMLETIRESFASGADKDEVAAKVVADDDQTGATPKDQTGATPEGVTEKDTPSVRTDENGNVIMDTAGDDEEPEEDPDARRQREREARRFRYDLDIAAKALIVRWSYKHPTTKKRLSVKLEHIRRLDSKTKAWLHGRVLDAIDELAAEDYAGNS